MGHEYVPIVKLRRLCSTIDPRHLKQVKTDSVLFQGVAKRNLKILEKAAEARYEDGSPIHRFLDEGAGLKPLLVDCERLPMEARRPEDLPEWQTIAEDAIEEHILGGNLF